jgi:hypothetical protein
LGLSVATQLKVVPAILAVNPKLSAVPEQTVAVVPLVITGGVQAVMQTGPVSTTLKLQTLPP